MSAIENISLMVFLMAIGISATAAILIGFIYYLEASDD